MLKDTYRNKWQTDSKSQFAISLVSSMDCMLQRCKVTVFGCEKSGVNGNC